MQFGAPVGIGCTCLYGGAPKHTQKAALAKPDCRVIVATPGRLTDLVERDGALELSAVRFLVLDEVRHVAFCFVLSSCHACVCISIRA